MGNKRWATSSSIERVLECPASAVLPGTNNVTKYSSKGNMVHKLIELKDLDGLKKINVEWDALAIPNEARHEVSFSYDVVSGKADTHGVLGGHENYPDTPFSTVFGTVDVVGRSILLMDGLGKVDCIDIVDWKTSSEMPPADSWQMRILAFMAARSEGYKFARTRITHIREGVRHSEWKLWNGSDFDATELMLRRAYDKVNKLGWKEEVTLSDVRYGPHCHFCPAYLSCPYPKSLLRDPGDGSLANIITNVDAVNAYNKWQSLRTLAGKLEEVVRGFAVATPIQLPGGYRYGKSPSGKFMKFKEWRGEEE